MANQLLSLTLLATQWEKYNKSYLDNFVPLFATFLVKKNKISFKKKIFPHWQMILQNFMDYHCLHIL